MLAEFQPPGTRAWASIGFPMCAPQRAFIEPSPILLFKIARIVDRADRETTTDRAGLDDPEVKAWLKGMRLLVMLP
jgi:hypothetical protein